MPDFPSVKANHTAPNDIIKKINDASNQITRINSISREAVNPKCFVGSFTNPIATGLYKVTGLGFKPEAILFFVSKNDGLATWFCECMGFADSNNHQNVSAWTGNYSNTFRGDMKFDRCIYAFNASGVKQAEATLVSMDDDGFTLNFTVAGNTAFSIRWIAQ